MTLATYLERAKQGLVHAHHRTRVVELATVVRCREEGDKVSFREELVAILHDLDKAPSVNSRSEQYANETSRQIGQAQ